MREDDGSGPGVVTAADLVLREWNPTEPNRLWVADITYCRSWEGWLYLSAVIDCYSRKVVGWSLGENLRAELVVGAVEMAVSRPRPDGTHGPRALHRPRSRGALECLAGTVPLLFGGGSR